MGIAWKKLATTAAPGTKNSSFPCWCGSSQVLIPPKLNINSTRKYTMFPKSEKKTDHCPTSLLPSNLITEIKSLRGFYFAVIKNNFPPRTRQHPAAHW